MFFNPDPKHKPIRYKKNSAAWRRIRAAVLSRDNGCVICGRPGSPHHIIYRSQSGDDSENNLVELCEYCHIPGAHERRRTSWASGMSKKQVEEFLFNRIKENST
jgi:5-methylcytosine-specific restriction endonuclease McrA